MQRVTTRDACDTDISIPILCISRLGLELDDYHLGPQDVPSPWSHGQFIHSQALTSSETTQSDT
eukprot:m.49772 g.49772  ORF g.49772 m.49772 type:complete len:64 (-) comp8979_c0_seq1:6492-6683(-)